MYSFVIPCYNSSESIRHVVELTMEEMEKMNRREFEKVRQPVFLGYYYKDADHQDQTVEVKAALKMFDELGTPENEKMKVAFPEAGAHVIACELTSKAVTEVRQQTFEFARKILKIN